MMFAVRCLGKNKAEHNQICGLANTNGYGQRVIIHEIQDGWFDSIHMPRCPWKRH